MTNTTISAYAIPGLRNVSKFAGNPWISDKAQYIEEVVSEYFGQTIKEVKVRDRTRKLVTTRHMMFFMLRRHTKLTLNEIAQRFKQGDHTTIRHGIISIGNLLKYDQDLKLSVELIEKKLQ